MLQLKAADLLQEEPEEVATYLERGLESDRLSPDEHTGPKETRERADTDGSGAADTAVDTRMTDAFWVLALDIFRCKLLILTLEKEPLPPAVFVRAGALDCEMASSGRDCKTYRDNPRTVSTLFKRDDFKQLRRES